LQGGILEHAGVLLEAFVFAYMGLQCRSYSRIWPHQGCPPASSRWRRGESSHRPADPAGVGLPDYGNGVMRAPRGSAAHPAIQLCSGPRPPGGGTGEKQSRR